MRNLWYKVANMMRLLTMLMLIALDDHQEDVLDDILDDDLFSKASEWSVCGPF